MTADTTADGPGNTVTVSYHRDTMAEVRRMFGSSPVHQAVLAARGAPRRSTGAVSEADIATLRTFVRPAGFDDVLSRLRRERIVVLCGRPHSGKRSSALSLLRAVTAKPLYLMSPRVSVRELAAYEYERDCGYAVVDRVVDRTAAESGFEWELVRDHLADNRGYLVVTHPTGAGKTETFALTACLRPTVEEVFRVHWREPVQWSDENANELAHALRSIDRVQEAVRLARQLGGGRPLPEALDDLDSRVQAVVRKWFDDHLGNWPRLLEITALAFLAGADERRFEAGLLRLERTLGRHRPEPVPGEDVPAADPRHALRERAKGNRLLSITAVPAEVGSRNALVFARPGFHRHVLAELWQRMDVSFWDGVGGWLDELVVSPGYEMCIAAGLSELTAVAIDEVLPIAERWARGSCGPAGQRVTAGLLQLMAIDDSSAPSALKIATEWILRNTPAHRWVAAMAFAGRLGARYPHDARRRLWQACVRPEAVEGEIEHVFGEFFGTLVRSPGGAQPVLSFLGEKAERFLRPGAQPKTRAITARIVVAVLESKDARTGLSSVVTHLGEYPADTGDVARLLAAVLEFRPARRRVLAAWHELLEDLAHDHEHADERARALGTALRAHLRPAEQKSLASDFRIVAARRRGADIGSLINAVFDAPQGRGDGGK